MSLPMIPRAALRLVTQKALTNNTRAIAPTCRLLSIQNNTTTRLFSSTPIAHKKAGKANKSNARSDSSPPVRPGSEPTPTDDVFDLSYLESQVLKAIEKLTHELSQLRSGGRLNPEVVEALKVQISVSGDGGDAKSKEKETVKLSDIAQVVPRGRVLNIICGDPDHIKPVSSAIAASPHSLTPLSPESSNPLTIQVPLPPPTGETRRAAITTATNFAAEADKRIQNARQTHNKGLRKRSLERSVLPDDLQKAGKLMEEVVKNGHSEVKRIVEGAKKVLESQ